MDVTSTPPDVFREPIGDVALKTYTLYFLIAGTILGVLLFAGIKKASKICCWNCIYGSKYIRDQKEDPRVPPSVFRAPSVLTTLQDRYDKHKSSIRSKSDGASQHYVRAQDIEMGSMNYETDTAQRQTFSGLISETDENARIHRYLDSMDEFVPEKRADSEEIETQVEVSGAVVQIELSDDDTDAKTFNSNVPSGMSNYGSMPVSDGETSQKRQSNDYDGQDINEPVYSTIGKASTNSQGTLRSTATNDMTPLVSMDTSGDTNRRGRYKKNSLATPAGTGISNRTASAKSSKKSNR